MNFDHARAELESGDAHGALTAVEHAMTGDPFPPLDVVSRAAAQLGLSTLQQAVERAAADQRDADALFGLGYHMLDVGLNASAVAPLRAALQLRPTEPTIVRELAVALGRLQRSVDAAAYCGRTSRPFATTSCAHTCSPITVCCPAISRRPEPRPRCYELNRVNLRLRRLSET